jgi:hypothetical protein
MILATHVVFGAYGFWLPNDPRGSGWDFVWSKPLQRFGPATKVQDQRRSRAALPHNRELRLAAKEAIKHPAAQFTGVQAWAVARGFPRACAESGYILQVLNVPRSPEQNSAFRLSFRAAAEYTDGSLGFPLIIPVEDRRHGDRPVYVPVLHCDAGSR